MDNVATFRGAHVVATPLTDDPAYMDIDGEAPGIAPAEFIMHAGAIGLFNARTEVV